MKKLVLTIGLLFGLVAGCFAERINRLFEVEGQTVLVSYEEDSKFYQFNDYTELQRMCLSNNFIAVTNVELDNSEFGKYIKSVLKKGYTVSEFIEDGSFTMYVTSLKNGNIAGWIVLH